jgi:hypothetical protein
MTALHAGCRAENIRKGSFLLGITRLPAEVFVRHTVHDVQLPIHNGNMQMHCFAYFPHSPHRRYGRMYYTLKEAGIIKGFAEISG